MELNLISERLAALALTVEGINRADGFVPDSVTTPHFYVGEIGIDYDQTFHGQAAPGMSDVQVACRVLSSTTDDKAGQNLLKTFMSDFGPASVKAVLEGTPGVAQTLGGACDDLHVRRVQNHRIYRVGEGSYFGAEWVVRVIG